MKFTILLFMEKCSAIKNSTVYFSSIQWYLEELTEVENQGDVHTCHSDSSLKKLIHFLSKAFV